ncbi:hypothetical protein LCGC14_0558000 [marine sediment metagenome]|uniref:Uncharacterized protein n=1 Tax=marine sediment metagenome TaxID=412755 RepID=A0A0F9S6M6_9ZZZZ
MHVRVQKGTCIENEPVDVANVNHVIIFDDRDGTPLTAIEQLGESVIHVTHCTEPEFPMILRRLGVKAQPPAPVLPGVAVKV